MRDRLPTGTVTFVFTDVEGSTRLLHELGAERYAEALQEHRAVVREAVAARGGVEVDTQGDAFFFAFPTAPDAIAAAAAATDALRAGRVRVRMGVHTGTPLLAEEGYVGVDVHRAARIAACGHGGQVLVSASAASLAGVDGLRDLGEHRLKDLSAPERIYQVGDAAFPPLKSLYRTNLPIPATPFVGRSRELAEVEALLAGGPTRLLTLSGPGGTGKTRLALQAAAAAADAFPDGVWWVPLAPLRSASLVVPTVAQALGAQEELAAHVGGRRLLLVLDNFEHVIEAAGEIAALLAACPGVRLLVTSRELLRVPAEQAYAVEPLAAADGVELFLARARAADVGFAPSAAVADLCARLEQLPLALELAAARVRVLSPEQLLDRLSRRLDLLRAGRGVDPRQQTLRATIEWSHELLEDDERRLFARLAAFPGGWTLEAAERVCSADLDVLHALVDKSLVRVRENGRFWMLETIREFAAELLEASGEAPEVRRLLAEHFVALARRAGLSLEPSGPQRFGLVDGEVDNVRAALEWALETDPVLGLELATLLEMFWVAVDPREGMRWFERLLPQAAEAPAALRARALLAYGSSANPGGDDAAAERAYAESLALYREVGDEHGICILLFRLANSAFYRGDLERADELAEETLERARRTGNRIAEAQAHGLLGELAWARGRRTLAVELIGRSAELAGEVDFPWWRSRMLRKLVDCALDLGRLDDAGRWARESLDLLRRIGDRQATVFALARLARVAAEHGRGEEAGVLWGAIEAEEERLRMGGWEKERGRFLSPTAAAAGREFAAGRERGRALSLEEAVERALAGDAEPA